jgi:hypothetical protein
MAGVARRQQLRNPDLARAPAPLAEAGDRLVDFCLAALGLAHQAGDRPAVTGNDNGLAALDLVEDLRQMGLRLRRRDLAHIWAIRQVKMTGHMYARRTGVNWGA